MEVDEFFLPQNRKIEITLEELDHGSETRINKFTIVRGGTKIEKELEPLRTVKGALLLVIDHL